MSLKTSLLWYQILETMLGAMLRAKISGLKLCAFNTTPCTNYSTNITNQIWFKPPNKVRKIIMLNYGKLSYNQDVKLEKNTIIDWFVPLVKWHNGWNGHYYTRKSIFG